MWPKYLDVCFVVTFGVTLILSYTVPEAFVHRWLQVIIMGGLAFLVAVSHSANWCSIVVFCSEGILPKDMQSVQSIAPDELSLCTSLHERS